MDRGRLNLPNEFPDVYFLHPMIVNLSAPAIFHAMRVT